MNTMDVNGRVFQIEQLLGKGKGGYSYLVTDEEGAYVLKQIHHEPCSYYTFGDKLAAELHDYDRLCRELSLSLERKGLNIDYYPTNFVVHDGMLFYIDYECNAFDPRWSFENWGAAYWSGTEATHAGEKETRV